MGWDGNNQKQRMDLYSLERRWWSSASVQWFWSRMNIADSFVRCVSCLVWRRRLSLFGSQLCTRMSSRLEILELACSHKCYGERPPSANPCSCSLLTQGSFMAGELQGCRDICLWVLHLLVPGLSRPAWVVRVRSNGVPTLWKKAKCRWPDVNIWGTRPIICSISSAQFNLPKERNMFDGMESHIKIYTQGQTINAF